MTPTIAFLPNLGGPELIVIFAVILILFGAKKLPEFARGLGKSMGEFKRARKEFEDEIIRAEQPDSTPATKKAPSTEEEK